MRLRVRSQLKVNQSSERKARAKRQLNPWLLNRERRYPNNEMRRKKMVMSINLFKPFSILTLLYKGRVLDLGTSIWKETMKENNKAQNRVLPWIPWFSFSPLFIMLYKSLKIIIKHFFFLRKILLFKSNYISMCIVF